MKSRSPITGARYTVAPATGRLIGLAGLLIGPVSAGTGVLFGYGFVGACSPIVFAGARYTVVLATGRLIGPARVLIDPVGAGTASLIGSG
jgi:hypothetical protein